MAIAAAEKGASSEFRVDFHAHSVKSGTPPGEDGWQNTPDRVIPKLAKLLRTGRINAIGLAEHDRHPTEQLQEIGRAFPNTETIGVIEATAHVPANWRIGEFAHVNGLFEKQPEHWPFPPSKWPKRLRDKAEYIRSFPSLKEIITAIRDQDGLLVFAHPGIPWPWGSLSFGEIDALREGGHLPKDVGIELNGANVFRLFNKLVERYAKQRGYALVGGSDAHNPDNIGRQLTKVPRGKWMNLWKSVKTSFAERTSSVIQGPLVRT